MKKKIFVWIDTNFMQFALCYYLQKEIDADFYAIMLLILAFSGLFMFPVKRLIKGRGIVLVSVGFIVPFGYVYLMS